MIPLYAVSRVENIDGSLRAAVSARVERVEERMDSEVIQMSHYSKPLTTIVLDKQMHDVFQRIGCQSRPKPGAARPTVPLAGRRPPGPANAIDPIIVFWNSLILKL
jgi:hypothetical protein